MELVIGLCVLGIALIAVEALVPGGILGILGVCAIVGGTVYAFNLHGMEAAAATFTGAFLVCGIVLLVELKYLPHTKAGRRLMLKSTNKATSVNPIASEDIIGKQGRAATRLNPTGVVRIDDREYECFSEDGQAEKGTQVEVIRRESFRLVVRRAKNT